MNFGGILGDKACHSAWGYGDASASLKIFTSNSDFKNSCHKAYFSV